MPFTLSHPLVAIVLRRTGLPVLGMVAGSIAPDLPMFLPTQVGYSYTHSILGVVTADLLISLVMVAAWVFLVRDALVDSAPGFVRERFAARTHYAARQWMLIPVAAAIGSLSHVGWDELTHANRWGDRHVAWLHAEHAGWADYHWAQAVSSIAGLGLVVVWSAVAVLRRERRDRVARVTHFAGRAAWMIPVVTAVAGAGAALDALGSGVHAAAFAAAVTGTVALALALLVRSPAWQLLTLRSR